MKKLILTVLFSITLAIVVFGQNLTQTVRGKVIDADSRLPLPYVTVVLLNGSETSGTVTDDNGYFKMEEIPIGRISLQFSFIGYETLIVPDISVNSSQQVVINVELVEAVTNLDEVVVKANKNKGEALNDMAIISSRSISPQETRRYAGGFDDPSHLLTNFAGVTGTQDGNNDIIVRGNSPKYVQWRLEGLEITAPNHQSDQNSTVAGFSALNNKLLSTSDFYTGAFTPEFGNVLSSVYSVKLRPGNNEKFEAAAGIGLMGTELILEGPFKKGYAGSYLFNYRYSTIGLMQDIGLVSIPGISTTFQDATFKIVLPTKKAGIFSFFGLTGFDNLIVDDLQPNIWETPGEQDMLPEIVEDFDHNNYLANFGMKHGFSINNNSYLNTMLMYSARGINEKVFESTVMEVENPDGTVITDTTARNLNYKSTYQTASYKAKMVYNNKINAKNKLQIGAEYTLNNYSTEQSMLGNDNISRIELIDFKGNVNTFQSFVSWKHRFNEQITLVSGVHNMNVLLNSKSTIEPRAALEWEINTKNSLHIGYGNHSTMERIHNYYTKIENTDGDYIYPNKDLGLLKAHHYIVGYKRKVTQNISANIDIYYQDLYNLPVENDENSFYATLNESSDYRYVDLVNKGTGKNYGFEITLERYFNNNFYFLLNGTFYESKYTALDGIERNTRFNNNTLINFLVGKEFDKLGKKKNKVFAVNLKAYFNGGQRYIPLLRNSNGELSVDAQNGSFYDYSKAYESKFDKLYEVNLSVSYKINLPRITHELFLDLTNLTNNRGRMAEFYDTNEPDNIGYIRQMEFLPNFMYRIYF